MMITYASIYFQQTKKNAQMEENVKTHEENAITGQVISKTASQPPNNHAGGKLTKLLINL